MRSCRLNAWHVLDAHVRVHTHGLGSRALALWGGGRQRRGVWDLLRQSSLTQWKMKGQPLLPCPSTPVRFPILCSEQGKHLSVLTNLNQGGSQAQQPCLGIPSPLKGLSIHLPLGQP